MTGSSTLFDFMIGDWNVEFDRLPQGARSGAVPSRRLPGSWMTPPFLTQWRHLDESGDVNFRGATFRTLIPAKDLWYMLWMTPAVEGFSELYARRVGDEVHTSGKGKDPGGEFVERGRYSAITADAFSFDKQELPKTLFIPNELPSNNLVVEAQRQQINIFRVPEYQLRVFIAEAREAFRERFGGGNRQ